MTTVDAYIRVSRVGDRDGDSFLSPELQREAIETLCKREKLEVVNWYEELDASGGDAKRPLWLEAISRVEKGESQGIAVWNLSRFSRSLKDAMQTLERIEDAGGALYSASEGFDNTPSGRLTRNLFFAIAQMERERARDGFRNAINNAIDRGIFVAAVIPYGYLRNPETRKLEPNPETAPIVKELFEMRSRKLSYDKIRLWLFNEHGHSISRPGLKSLFANSTYLGSVRSGNFLKANAHPPLISKKLFDEVNGVKARKSSGDGSLTGISLLAGILKCEHCGSAVSLGSSLVQGQKSPHYYCRNILCSAKPRPFARMIELDSIFEDRLFDFIGRKTAPAVIEVAGDEKLVEDARRAYEDADYLVKLHAKDARGRITMGEDLWQETLEELVTVANVAKAELEEVLSMAKVTSSMTVADQWQEWTTESRREFVSKLVQSATLTAGKEPVSERLTVKFNRTNFHQAYKRK